MRGAPAFQHKSEATVIEKSPIFPRIERVLAELAATLRESCSPEMTKISDFGGKKPASIFFPKLAPDNADLHRVSEAAALARKPYKRTYGDGWTLWTQQQPWSISRQVLSLIMNPRRRVDNV